MVLRNSMLLRSQQPSIALLTACFSERNSPVLRWKQLAVANATRCCSEADCMLMRTPLGAAANARRRHAAQSASTNSLPAEWPNALKYIVKIRRSEPAFAAIRRPRPPVPGRTPPKARHERGLGPRHTVRAASHYVADFRRGAAELPAFQRSDQSRPIPGDESATYISFPFR